MGINYGTVLNCTVSGSVYAILESDHNLDCGGIVGDNQGTVSGCTFEGNVAAAVVGGIAGANSGAVSGCQVLIGSVSTGGKTAENTTVYAGGVIGHIYTNTSSYANVIVSGNTFSRVATGQQWGIGEDSRLSPPAPSNNGTTPII